MPPLPTINLSSLPETERKQWHVFLAESRVKFEFDPSRGEHQAIITLKGINNNNNNTPPAKPQLPREDFVERRARAAMRALAEAQGELPPYAKFVSMLGPMTFKKPNKRTLNWTKLRVRDVLDARDEYNSMQDGDVPSFKNMFPVFCFWFFFNELGLKQLVDSTAWDFVLSVHSHRAASPEIDMFARFLDETYDADDLAFFLHARNVARKRQREHSFANRGHLSLFASETFFANVDMGSAFLKAFDSRVSGVDPRSTPSDVAVKVALDIYRERKNLPPPLEPVEPPAAIMASTSSSPAVSPQPQPPQPQPPSLPKHQSPPPQHHKPPVLTRRTPSSSPRPVANGTQSSTTPPSSSTSLPKDASPEAVANRLAEMQELIKQELDRAIKGIAPTQKHDTSTTTTTTPIRPPRRLPPTGPSTQ